LQIAGPRPRAPDRPSQMHHTEAVVGLGSFDAARGAIGEKATSRRGLAMPLPSPA